MRKLHYECPDVLIIGGQRCGTTWLAEALREVEGVWVPPKLKPESKIFLDPLPCVRKKTFADDLRQDLMDSQHWSAPSGVLKVDKATRYLTHPGTPEAVAKANPDMKIIVMLRDPTDRAWSHWRYSFSEGAETQPFSLAVAAEPARALVLPPEEMHKYAYIGHGLYGFHLSIWMQHFRPEQFLVIFVEELDDPNGLMTGKVLPFLGDGSPSGVGHSGDKWPGVKNQAPSYEDQVDQTVWDTQDMLLRFFRADAELLDSVLRGTMELENPYLR